MDLLIDVANLTKNYGDLVAVSQLTFNVAAGSILGLVGPNGAGKTTTLRALAGIHPATEGQVRICGYAMRTDPVEAKRNLAFMPDEPRLFDYLTVLEHLQFIGRLYGVPDSEEKSRVLLAEFELKGKSNVLPGELSRGMKQKLMIACGLLHSPRVLIFDEPLTGIDPIGIRKLKQSIIRRAKEGAAIILSSHLLHLVEEVCDSILVIQNGRQVAWGTIRDLKWRLAQSQGDLTLEEAFFHITAGTPAEGEAAE